MTTLTSYTWPQPPLWLKGVPAGRENFLSAVPLNLHETTCRCSRQKFEGWYWNEQRNMWVCGSCHKPSAAHQGYNVVCIYGCGEDFTIWKFGASEDDPIEKRAEAMRNARNELCSDCGGSNDARLFI